MLNFGMEMRRINDIIRVGAASKMSDVEFLEHEVKKWLASPQRAAMLMGDAYYDYEHSILKRKRMVIRDSIVAGRDEMGREIKAPLWEEEKNLPNNKNIDNQYAKMVNQKVNFLLSKPFTLDSDNEQYKETLGKVFNMKFHKTLKNIGKDMYNCGIAWLHPYYDENGEFKIKRFRPWEIIPFWKDDDHTELDFAVRVYDLMCYQGQTENVETNIDVYDTNGIHHLVFHDEKLIPDYSTYHFEMDIDKQTEPYNWNRVPLIPIRAYSNESTLLKRVKPLQDAINKILSDFDNSMEENASGNSILIIENYGGTDLGEFRRNLSQYKAVKVKSTDGGKGDVRKLEIEVNADNYKIILELLKKALIENAMGYDVNDLKSAGSPNEMTIKSVYTDIDLDANETETELQASFEDLLWFINQHLANTGQGSFENEEIDIIFNRDMLVVETDVINNIKNSVGILSTETLVAQHPWVKDVDKELDRLKAEKEEEQAELEKQMYGNAFGPKPDNVGGDVNAE